MNTIIYLYEDSSWGDLLTSYNGRTITYDTIGNPLNDGIWSYTWEQGRRLTKMQSSSATWNYAYDTTGLRTSRSNGTTNYRYWYNDSGLLLRMEKGSTVYSFTYDPAGRPVSVTEGNARYYYVLNQQGDVIGLLNSNEELIVMYVYDAWGCVLASADLTASGIGTNNPLRYRGYVYDTEAGLYYLQSRYYNPTWGRFINADGQLPGVGGNVIGYNLFAYCLNNPVNMSDPLGNWPSWRTIFKVAATVITVTAVAVAIVATAGTAGVAAGMVSAAVVKSAVIGTAAGGVVAGTTNAFAQGITKGEKNINYKELAASTFAGSMTGTISGGASSLVPTAARGTTALLAQKACQIVINTSITIGSYMLTSPEPTVAGFTTSVFSGIVSGATFNTSFPKSIVIAFGLELAGYAEEIIYIFVD